MGAAAPSAQAASSPTLTVGLSIAPDNLDPNVSSSADDSLVMRAMFDSLVNETPAHTFAPWLATSWTISPNGLHYTFQLRHGVTFADGTSFNAAAVKFNFDRIEAPATKSQFAVSLLGPYKSSTVLGPYTVELNLKYAYSPLMEGLSEAFLGFNSPTAVAKYGANYAEHPVGTGPFMFDSMVNGQKIVLSRNPHYDWPPAGSMTAGPPALSSLTFEVVPQDSTRIGALESGQLGAAESVPTDQIASLKGDSQLAVSVVNQPGAVYSLYLNEDKAPWGDPVAREALRDAIDVPAIIKTLYFGQFDRAWSVLSPSTAGYDAALAGSWSYDPAKAVKLFESIGYKPGSGDELMKDGKPLTFLMVNNTPDYQSRFEIDTIVKQQLASIGVTEDISDVAFAPYASATENGDYAMESFSVVAGTADILNDIFNSDQQPGPGNFLYNVAHFSSKAVDNEAVEAEQTTNPATEDRLYDEIQQAVIGTAVAIPIYVSEYTFAISKQYKGLTFDDRAYPIFYGVS
jgi:peptide/nickel transport system substrate-binding protein